MKYTGIFTLDEQDLLRLLGVEDDSVVVGNIIHDPLTGQIDIKVFSSEHKTVEADGINTYTGMNVRNIRRTHPTTLTNGHSVTEYLNILARNWSDMTLEEKDKLVAKLSN